MYAYTVVLDDNSMTIIKSESKLDLVGKIIKLTDDNGEERMATVRAVIMESNS